MITASRLTPAPGELGERHVGVGLEPLGAAEARLEGRCWSLFFRPAETLAEEPHRLLALAVIGIALVDIIARQAVEGGEHQLRLEVEPGRARR